MEIHASERPSAEAGLHISKILQGTDTQYLVLLSGGSALSVLDTIDPSVLGAHVTFMMADERFSDDPKVNNYLQFTQTELFARIGESGAKTIESVPDADKGNCKETAVAIQMTLEYYFKVHDHCHVIALLGVGEDGHTAGIFPKKSVGEFSQKYLSASLYIPIVEESNAHKERMTVTPYFIKNYVNEVVMYVTSEKKCSGILSDMLNEESQEHEIPALIASRHQNTHLYTDCTTL
jgi:6-phosphogluconolactonase/glucosamine-6-phosphate isomerase/deaminase